MTDSCCNVTDLREASLDGIASATVLARAVNRQPGLRRGKLVEHRLILCISIENYDTEAADISRHHFHFILSDFLRKKHIFF